MKNSDFLVGLVPVAWSPALDTTAEGFLAFACLVQCDVQLLGEMLHEKLIVERMHWNERSAASTFKTQ
ncbi:MAG: hypothetical protein EOO38_04095 [Cytophagaceae bacterium]|nr:MAG: hypothetical protein EOO38_04095 [Cytophagaceae bacterium]